MTEHQVLEIYACVQGSLTGTTIFPEIVTRLGDVGVERYHADYCRQEITYYLDDGDSAVVATPHESAPIGREFSAAAVEAAVRASQRGEHTYSDFVRKTRTAGCIGYVVQIAGRRVCYFGRRGEIHVEPMPTPS